MPPSPTDRSSPGSCSAPAARRAWGGPSSCSPYGDGTLLGHVVGVARACAFDQLDRGDRRRGRRGARAASTWRGAEVVVNDAYGEGCSSSIAAALGAVDPRCDVLVLMLGDQPGRDRRTRSRRCSPAAATRRSRCAATTTAAGTRSRSRARSSASSPTCTATRASGGCSTSAPTTWPRCRSPARSRSTSTPRRTTEAVLAARAPHEPARGHRRGGGRGPPRSCPTSRRSRGGSPPSTTSSTRAWRRRCSSALRLPQPLLLEGEAGVGKTEAAQGRSRRCSTRR